MLAIVPPKRTDGGSSFATLGRYSTEELNMQTGEIMSRGEVMISDALLSPETAAAEMKSVAAQNTRCKDAVVHYVLSWDGEEVPTPEQWKDAVNNIMDSVGMKDHQYMAVAHSDTDNFHVHIMANKVHPETYKSHTPSWLFYTLDESLRKIEHKHNWKASNGFYRWDDELGLAVPTTKEERQAMKKESNELGTGKAAKMEIYSGVESLEAYCKKEPVKALNAMMKGETVKWYDVHLKMQEYGLQIHKGESGGYTVSAQGEDGKRIHVKASKVFRNHFSGKNERAATDAKLGDWKEPLTTKQQSLEKENVNANERERSNDIAGGKQFSRKPGIGRIGRKPPPQNKNRLRKLSELGVVRINSGSEMLLSGDVSGNVEHHRAKLNNELRRDISGTVEPRQKYDRKATGRTATVRTERGLKTAQKKADFQQYKAEFYDARKVIEATAKQADKQRLSNITSVAGKLRQEIRAIESPEIKKAMLAAVTDATKKERLQVRREAQARRKASRMPTFREWVKANSLAQVQDKAQNAREDVMKAVNESFIKALDERQEQKNDQRRQDVRAPAFDPAKIQAEWKAEQSRQFAKVQQKAYRVKGKIAAVLERQTSKRRIHEQNRPEQPKGLFAGFKQNEYQDNAKVWQGLADSLAKRWLQLDKRDKSVNDYTERSNVPGWPSKGERLAERWAADANPPLAQAVEVIKQQGIEKLRQEMEQKQAYKKAWQASSKEHAAKLSGQGLTKEQIAKEIKEKLKAERDNTNGPKL